MIVMPNHMHCIIENVLNAHDAFQNKNENSNDSLQRDAHVGTSLRGRPVDENQCFTNGQIENYEIRGCPVDENYQQSCKSGKRQIL
jgi:hypothetical protein